MAKGKKEGTEKVTIKKVDKSMLQVSIAGIVPYVQHKWAEKAKQEIRNRKTGIKNVRTKCDPEAECEAAMYRLSDGRHGIPITAIKKAMILAAHKDYGIPRTTVASSVFVHAEEYDEDGTPLVLLQTSGHKMREDAVRVGQGAADLRYRPEFQKWKATLVIEYDSDALSAENVVNLLDRAGYKVGIGEGRPEKQSGLDWGRFEVVAEKEVKCASRRK